ncbi:hypothetical protein BDZ89DRAFT_1081995 [Hymenopellis radicata]|nr:hypothetical protein BDZ89DRAFT_1081995 [Hymenopellis radicata]
MSPTEYDYDEYIKDDLENSRVVLHVEKFLELVFDIPLPYHQGKLYRILDDKIFCRRMTEFLAKCDAGLEKPLYGDIAPLYDRGLELLDALDPLPNDVTAREVKTSVDNHDILLCDGKFHTLGSGVNDRRPLHDVENLLHQNDCPTGRTVPSTQDDAVKVTSAASRKRERSGSLDGESETPATKVPRQSQDPFSSIRNVPRLSPAAEDDAQVQCGRYAMELLSNIFLRSHAILTLFDSDGFQIHYYDRSVIAVSSVVSLSSREGQEQFILMLMGLRRLNGLRLPNVLHESQKFYMEFIGQISECSSKEWCRMFHGMTLRLGGETYTLQEILFRQPGVVGRATCVVAAKDSHGTEVVVKISCPIEGQTSEVDLIEHARAYASRDDGHKWVLKHLPKVFASVDIAPDPRSAQRRLCEFLNNQDTKWAGKQKLVYEIRILCITVVEKLHPLLNIASPSTHAQIFFDVLQTHKWLYDHPRILHRDISMSNIMFRIDENGDYFGVLNDLDLASLRSDLDSRLVMGTPPFMAMDLQDPYHKDVQHLYRHDLESLFYVIVLLVVRHKIGKSKRGDKRVQLDDHPDLEGWFDPKKSWKDLRASKNVFMWEMPKVVQDMIKPDFKGFEEWIMRLRWLFFNGLAARMEAQYSNTYPPADSVPPVDPAWIGGGAGVKFPPTPQEKVPYCEETLGDFITYRNFGQIMLRFGQERLKIRYRYQVP